MNRPILLALFAGTLTPLAHAQCPNTTWTGHFATPALGLNSNFACALQVFDPDGPGPLAAELYVGGSFTTAGGITSKGIARWNGTSWSDVGGGFGVTPGNPSVSGLGLHDPDGPGPQLPVLVVAGSFTTAGTTPVNNFAAWDGQQWMALGSGITSIGQVSFVDYDFDGPGPEPAKLVAASQFQTTVGTYPSFIRWDGTQWSEFGPGPFWPTGLAVFDEDGPGPNPPALFAGLDYTPGLVKWDGASWLPVGGGLIRSAEHRCAALRVIDEDGPGPGLPALFAGGTFTFAGPTPVQNIARWNGHDWTSVAGGVPAQVEDIIAVDSPTGGPSTLYATSTFSYGIHRWTPGEPQWTQIGSAVASFGIFYLNRLAAFDDDAAGPQPPSIYFAATGLSSVNNTPSRGIARYGCTSCYANCDGSILSPTLNVNDFICFLNRFAAGDSYANCDGSTIPPAMNVNDFVCFNNRFASGCP